MSFPKREPTIATTVRLPESVYYEARALLTDPRTGELRYDSWAPLIARLLREWVDQQKVARIADVETCV